MTDILREIGVIARSLDGIANIEFKQFDLTRGQYLYLVRIAEQPGIIPDQLAELIKVDRTTAARAISKLENHDFIEKKNDPENKKIKRLYVTDQGQAAAAFILRENNYSNQMALQNLSAIEIAELARLMAMVKKNVEADWEYVKKGGKRTY
ncbi:MarR family winged helix-turn-helix transcriptional regulator [Enterococcus alishanensis]|uniref:MarR family transcriptional regulator n=1 Tax=Enterococcus alishanensis TaxID=1303817 RepID=A0ABS6TGK8_9ENTE|nr:MarR family transcriptional regulator [Enterococcus alishanensis]MBV7392021.1 MarR family transcriptional regulator [Enterococcus alishanensis]